MTALRDHHSEYFRPAELLIVRNGTEELKIVRTGSLPGQPTTTLKEEVKVVDESRLSGDEEKDVGP